MRAVTKAQIVKGLRKMGLKEGDIVVCHASMAAFGKVTGGAKTVVDALLETIGKQGTLVMPSHSGERPYDYRKSPSALGSITEDLRKRKGVVRGLHPIMPGLALGPGAAKLVLPHHESPCPNIGSPYDLAAAAGGYVLLLGVDQDRNTTLHSAEAMLRVAYTNPVKAPYVGRDGKTHAYEGKYGAGPHRDFIGADPAFRKAGIVKVGKIGKCVARLMKGQDLIDFSIEQLKKDEAFFMTDNDGYYGGIMQRGKIRAARVAREESFRLLARTSSAGRNMEEVFWHAERAGVSELEVDVVDGRDISQLDETDLKYLKKRMTSRRMGAKVVRTNVLGDAAFRATVEAAGVLGACAILSPLTGSIETLAARARAAKRDKLDMLFENVAISSADAAALMKALDGKAMLAFNPAHVAAAGELPFLGAYRKLRHFIRYLAVTDASRLGAPCLPGHGNGEVKELISILRCRSFDGCFSLGASPAAGLAFDGIADGFYRLLDSC